MAQKYTYQIVQMPSGTVSDAGWLNAYGSGTLSGSSLNGAWQLIQIIPITPTVISPTNGAPAGNILCYFMSSST